MDKPSATAKSRYGRVLVKLSGEALAGDSKGFGIDLDIIEPIAKDIAAAPRWASRSVSWSAAVLSSAA